MTYDRSAILAEAHLLDLLGHHHTASIIRELLAELDTLRARFVELAAERDALLLGGRDVP